uniref:Uncharacterized protein n=1 Tax=Oryza meridionalis TaxID=40149 RepID=A0A0E0C8T0_9ORYZ
MTSPSPLLFLSLLSLSSRQLERTSATRRAATFGVAGWERTRAAVAGDGRHDGGAWRLATRHRRRSATALARRCRGCRRGGVATSHTGRPMGEVGKGSRRRAMRWRDDTEEGALRVSPAWGTMTARGTSSSIRTRISVSSASSGSSTPAAASDSNSSAMPSDLTASRASERRATLARSLRSGWIEAVVVGRATQGAPIQPAAVGAGEGATAAPELRRRVR